MKKKWYLGIASMLAMVSLVSCGEKGPQGEKGEDGAPGLNGSDGKDGVNGANGADGASLLTGKGAPEDTLGNDGDSYIDLDTYDYYVKADGAWAKQGNIKGKDGADEQSGGNGSDGSSGKSAYEIYVENYPGYTWGEKQWVSDLALGKLSVKVSFVENGGSEVEDKVYCKGEEVKIAETPSKENYSFTGWYLDEDTSVLAETSFIAKESLTLYASYSETAHSKGKLLSIPTTSIEGVPSAGLFSCGYCGEQYYDTVSYEDIGVPVINLDGDFTGMSKTNEVKLTASYDAGESSFECDATAKWQGGVSINYPKKNYNVKLYKAGTDYSKKNKVELFEGYGKRSKYTLKANYIDYSAARNVVSADIWGDVVKARASSSPLTALGNGGAVEGYPVLLFQNGEYQGLYTLNLPKDETIFGMDDETVKQAVLSTNSWSDSARLKEHIASDWSNGWEVEYCSTEDDETVGTSWVADSFNEFLDFLANNDGDGLKAGLGEYVDIDAAIDTLIYTSFIYATDNTAKNMLWATYDGKKWAPSMYDMDGAWGLAWDGSLSLKASDASLLNYNRLWAKVWSNYHDEVVARYKELRGGALSLSNINARFSSFFDSVPDMLYDSESSKWTAVPSQENNHETQIISWAATRAKTLDSYFGVTIDENCYSGTFAVDNGGSILVYKTQDYSVRGDKSLLTIARNGTTDPGLLDATGEGEISFKVIVPEGYTIDSVTVTGTYKNLNGPEDTGVENVYRITKVNSDLKIAVALVAVEG